MSQVIAARYFRGAEHVRELRAMFERNSASPRPGSLNRALRTSILLILTVAVIIGILAMHSFASATPHTNTVMTADSATMSAGSHHEPLEVANAISGPDCLGCSEDMSMALMWCVFALLTASLLLAAPRLLTGWPRQATRLLSFAASPQRHVGQPPRAPSLNVLCISRT
ncbi:DUF6153 family protein [Salinibacterium sp. TMP30]|uniref:DUF6153 family protein n=1 Tax=Salinibacterium sp. TMP30 TaxID=3138237 RepID=UPI003138F332